MLCEYSLMRETHGSKLAEKQTIQNWIADSAAEIQACRLMTLDAAHKIDEGDEARVEVSVIKYYAAQALHDVIDRAIQVHGALGVSDDTVRRWIDSGRLRVSSSSGPTTIDGAELAARAQEIATAPELGTPVAESARNRFTGLVTRVIKDSVMAQVDLQCGPFRVVSLMSREAVDELDPGLYEVDGRVEAESPGLRLHAVQFTPRPPQAPS
jgi:molybdopterin-binding protein